MPDLLWREILQRQRVKRALAIGHLVPPRQHRELGKCAVLGESHSVKGDLCTACSWSNTGAGGCTANTGYYVGPTASPVRVPPSPYMSAAVTIRGEVVVVSASSSFGGTYNELPYNAFAGVLSTSSTPNQWTAGSHYYTGTKNAYAGTVFTTVDGVSIHGEWLQLQTQTARVNGSYSLQAESWQTSQFLKIGEHVRGNFSSR